MIYLNRVSIGKTLNLLLQFDKGKAFKFSILKYVLVIQVCKIFRWEYSGTGKHLCQSLLFNNVVRACNFIKKETLAQVLSCEFYLISKNTFKEHHQWLLLFLERTTCTSSMLFFDVSWTFNILVWQTPNGLCRSCPSVTSVQTHFVTYSKIRILWKTNI